MDILDEVRQVIAKILRIPIERLTPDSRLDELGAESLDVIEIVFELEEKFGITIPFRPDEGFRAEAKPGQSAPAQMQFETIAEVANAVKALIDAKAPS